MMARPFDEQSTLVDGRPLTGARAAALIAHYRNLAGAAWQNGERNLALSWNGTVRRVIERRRIDRGRWA